MTEAREIVQRFYEAFQRKDAESMAACYAPDAEFSDPAFPQLNGREAGDMWRMLISRGTDLVLRFQLGECTANRCQVHWEARYTFSQTGRTVVNRITATIDVSDGLIIRHRDEFSFWRWSRQALGATGWLLGWTPFLQGKVQSMARKGLAHWQTQQANR